MKSKTSILIFAILFSLTGCSYVRSGGLTVSIVNHQSQPLTNLAFTYPGGSFGIPSVPAGGERARWVKPLSTGPLKLDFDDSGGHHSLSPVTLHRSDSGKLVLEFRAGGKIAMTDERH